MYRILSYLCWVLAVKSMILAGVILFTGGSAPEPILQALSAVQGIGMKFIPAVSGVLTFIF